MRKKTRRKGTGREKRLLPSLIRVSKLMVFRDTRDGSIRKSFWRRRDSRRDERSTYISQRIQLQGSHRLSTRAKDRKWFPFEIFTTTRHESMTLKRKKNRWKEMWRKESEGNLKKILHVLRSHRVSLTSSFLFESSKWSSMEGIFILRITHEMTMMVTESLERTKSHFSQESTFFRLLSSKRQSKKMITLYSIMHDSLLH